MTFEQETISNQQPHMYHSKTVNSKLKKTVHAIEVLLFATTEVYRYLSIS